MDDKNRVPSDDESVSETEEPVLVRDSSETHCCYDSSSGSSCTECDKQDRDPRFNLLRAAEEGDVEEVKRILAEEPDKVHLADANGYTPLHRACYNDRLEVAKLLISHGADYLRKTNDGWEPLHSAARWGATSCVAMLLDLPGVDINTKTKGGVTPLHLAVLNANFRETVVELLMNPGIDTRIVSDGHQTAFEVARSSGELYRLFEVTEPMFNL